MPPLEGTVQLAAGTLLVARGDGTWQVGGDGRSALVVEQADSDLLGLLAPADRPVAWPDLEHAAVACGVDTHRVRALMDRLGSAGLVRPTPAAPYPSGRGVVRIVGGCQRSQERSQERSRESSGGAGRAIGDTLADLLSSELDVAVVEDALRPTHHPPAGGATDDVVITVVVSPTTEPDRLVPEQLVRHDAAHLVLRPLPGGAVVGPLVVPGRTGCVRCADLLRRDVDPSWPTVLHSLTRTVVDPGPVAAAWAAAYAAGQVLAYAAGLPPETLGSTAELVAPAYGIRWRAWPAHPGCGCGW